MVRLFANVSGRPGFNPRWSHTKDSKNDTSLLNAQNYKVQIEGKWSIPRKGVVPPLYLEVKSWTRLIAFHIALIPFGKV